MSNIKERIETLKRETDSLKQQLKEAKQAAKEGPTLREKAKSLSAVGNPKLKNVRTLKGHTLKVYACHWCPDEGNTSFVSCGQDGVLIVWDALSAAKTHAIPLRCSWVMTCGISPSGTFAASGGLDNLVTIYNLQTDDNPPKISRELGGHGSHISCVRFLNDRQILSSSGDKTLRLWDLETSRCVTEFKDHHGDVLCFSLSPDRDTFVSGSTDLTSKLFDIRSGNLSQISFTAHSNDVNSVSFAHNGKYFVSGSEDRSARLFDIRSAQELIGYNLNNTVTSIELSRSGRYAFVGVSEFPGAAVWDAIKGEEVGALRGHKNQVSNIGLSGDGRAVCTASWDSTLKIWV